MHTAPVVVKVEVVAEVDIKAMADPVQPVKVISAVMEEMRLHIQAVVVAAQVRQVKMLLLDLMQVMVAQDPNG